MCDKHGKPVTSLCRKHGSLMCMLCLLEEHKQCIEHVEEMHEEVAPDSVQELATDVVKKYGKLSEGISSVYTICYNVYDYHFVCASARACVCLFVCARPRGSRMRAFVWVRRLSDQHSTFTLTRVTDDFPPI